MTSVAQPFQVRDGTPLAVVRGGVPTDEFARVSPTVHPVYCLRAERKV